ncbi:AAA family ATPase [Treponema primitia]|uniref:AAA family ATPase n=1 Tax=Treponema primitia TaxID=88058 RepID=UPI00397F72C3
MVNISQVRQAIITALPKETSSYGNPINSKQLYIPPGHENALQLNCNLIVGARGVGKSTWTSALAEPQSKSIIGANISELENTQVQKGFAETTDKELYPDIKIFNNLLQKQFEPPDIWQAVIVRWLSKVIDYKIPHKDWISSVSWVKKNAEQVVNIIQKASEHLRSNGRNALIVFDALDRTSNNWQQMDDIVRELLKQVLYLKTFSNISAKVFLREDQFSRNVKNFPDASKLLANRAELTWQMNDLHGLLWQYFCNAPGDSGLVLRGIYKEVVGEEPIKQGDVWVLHDDVKREGARQRKLFEKLAGEWMGNNSRRGSTYSWVVKHLADGTGSTSPRSFLLAIKEAAEESARKDSMYPLHYEAIKQGVQKASLNRVEEIAEDYPWIRELCGKLENLNVPIEFDSIKARWIEYYPRGPGNIKTDSLPPQNADGGWIGIKEELVRIGVFDTMRDGRINMPDIYRVGFRLGRKGGVKPVD